MTTAIASPPLADRAAIVDWYLRTRRRSEALFEMLEPEAYYAQPIGLRHPIVFYEGHLSAFSLNTLVKKGLGRRGIDERLERLFARGIDPDDQQAAQSSGPAGWPDRREVRGFVAAADALVLDALEHEDLDRPGVPLLNRGEAVYTIIEHELMHQETLLYMWHRLPFARKRSADYADSRKGSAADYADYADSRDSRKAAADYADYADSRDSRKAAADCADYADSRDSRKAAADCADYADSRDSRKAAADYADSRDPASGRASRPRRITREVIRVPAGRARLGARRGEIAFGWDNEFEAIEVEVPAFGIDRFDVTNGDYVEFIEAGGYRDERWWTPAAWQWVRDEHVEQPLFWEGGKDNWTWRGMFDSLPLPLDSPVYVSQAEAAAYAKWRGGRLPTEAEFHRAAYGTPSGDDRLFPWGSEPADDSRAVIDFVSWDPLPVGSRPDGRSAWGVEDLVGNGWEWTSTIFAPFPGFEPLPSYPEYSADFFDNQHFVIKGASPATARELIRPSFRNWFRPHYPYVYAAFRCVGRMKDEG